MLKSILHRYNHLRKKQLLESMLPAIQRKYAIVGAGLHSISVLFPILKQLNVPVSYVVTKNSDYSEFLKQIFPNVVCTNSLDHILEEGQVDGFFVSAKPSEHYNILQKIIDAGKSIFIEKPPCSNSTELSQLIEISNKCILKVGFQRRHWPANKKLNSLISKASNYSYKFRTGGYFGEDPITTLFIHPLDYIGYLFGEFGILSLSQHKDSSGIIIQAHTKHKNGITGLIELSTKGNWNDPVDDIQIDTATELLKVNYPVSINGQQKPKRILDIPMERVLHKPLLTKQYFGSSNFIVPAADLNSLYLQGFYDEIRQFIELTEGRLVNPDYRNDLPGLINLYSIMDQMQQKINSQSFTTSG